MTGPFHWLSRRCAALRHAREGTAAVEFALIMPVMMFMYFGAAEAASLLTVDRKVQSVAGAVGDLVARSNQSITEEQISDYFQAATSILAPYDLTDLVQTVTAVSVDDEGETEILWSVRYAGDDLSDEVDDHEVGDSYDLPAETIAIASGQTVIVAEVDYPYFPLLGFVFKNTVNLHRSALFMPRFGGTIGYL